LERLFHANGCISENLNKMNRKLTFFAVLLLLAMNLFGQTWTGITSDIPVPIKQTLIESTDQSIIIQFNVDGFFMNPVETPRGKEYQISIPDMVYINEKTAPELPTYGVSSIIPDLALMQVRILDASYTDFEGINVAPSKGHYTRSEDPSAIPFIYGPAYDQDAFYPDILAELQEPYIFRDYRGQVVTVYPVSYNPVTKILRVYHELVVELYNDGDGGENQFNRSGLPETMAREFKAIYDRHFINYAQQLRYPVLEEEGNLLIISHGPFMEAMEPFVEWKKTIGRPTEIVDVATIGTTTTAIKAFVLDYYNTVGLTHLLIVGDHQQVPSQSMSGGYSDYFYGYLVGSDSYNELFVGRFSAETVAHVETQVQRTIEYERDIDETATWIDYGIGIARNEGAGNGHNGGEADYVHMDYIRDSLLNYTYGVVYREYDGNVPGVTNTNATQISQRINDGASIINFCNHGSINGWSVGGYSSSHVNQLTNTGKLPFIWSVACDNGRFTSGTCFAEVWMRATDSNGEPTGAIGTKMSWISQPWQPPMTGQDEMVTILVEQREHIKRTLGGVSTNGSMKMIDLHGTSGRSTHDTWILFGDPTLTVRTDNPTPITASYMPAAFLGFDEFTVDADADGALVTLTINGEILGTGIIEEGTTTVSFPPLSEPGEMTIAILAHNRVTYLNTIEIIPAAGPYLIYTSRTINDQNGGNGNNQIDFSETIDLGVELKNLGIEPATNVVATLSTLSPYVTITDNTQSYGTIQPDQLMMIEDAFTFEVADDVPNNTTLAFNLEMESDEDTWAGGFSLVAYAPVLSVGNYFVSDPTGNNNGRLDPGETADIMIATLNDGQSDALAALAGLTLNDPYITLNNATYDLETIAAGQTVYATFNVTVSEDATIGHAVEFSYEVEAGAYTASKSFLTKIGLILEDFETGDFSMFNWTFGGNLPWGTTSVDPFEGDFSAKSGSISHSQNSQMILDYEVGAADSISFYVKVSSENNYDFMRFFINGTQMGQWSGTVPWTRVAYPVTAGQKTFEWRYVKDGSVSGGSDCAWVDYIIFPPMLITTGYAGQDATICEEDTHQLNASATNYNSVVWTTMGDGSFSNATILNPVYTPGPADIASGSANLKLTVTGSTTTIEDELTLTIHRMPAVAAGVDTQVCQDSQFMAAEAIAEHYTALLWESSGTGVFDDPTQLHATYTPSAGDIAAGSVELTLTALGQSPCGDASHGIVLSIMPQAEAFAGQDMAICEAGTAQPEATAANYASLLWTSSGTGTFDDPSLINAVYTPSADDVAAGTVILTLTAQGQGPCEDAVSEVGLAIHALPTAQVVSGDHTICLGETLELNIELSGKAPWEVVDGQGDTHVIEATPFTLELSPVANLTFELVSVTDANDCVNDATGSVTIEVEYAPTAPVVPAAPDTVDYAYHTTTVITTQQVENATGYTWNLLPAEAGTISADGIQATITWNTDYLGEATIKVCAANDCGDGPWSELTEVELISTVGIPEIAGDWGLAIYPNPSTGQLTLELSPNLSTRANIHVTNLVGKLVYSQSVAISGSQYIQTLNLSHLDNGMYILSIESPDLNVYRKLIIRK
jgi:hypothetical protein